MINGHDPRLEPFVCIMCGQSADERPGFSILRNPEAVGTVDGMIAVTSFVCNSCGCHYVVPAGTIDVRRP